MAHRLELSPHRNGKYAFLKKHTFEHTSNRISNVPVRNAFSIGRGVEIINVVMEACN